MYHFSDVIKSGYLREVEAISVEALLTTLALVFALGVRVLPWRLPELVEGEGSFLRAAQVLRREL